jgi:hypothetical protein
LFLVGLKIFLLGGNGKQPSPFFVSCSLRRRVGALEWELFFTLFSFSKRLRRGNLWEESLFLFFLLVDSDDNIGGRWGGVETL